MFRGCAGTIHLQVKGLAPICRKLGVDYAPAMMGFDVRGGRSIPLIEGVVVCEEFEQHVLLAFAEDEKCAVSSLAYRHRSVRVTEAARAFQRNCVLLLLYPALCFES